MYYCESDLSTWATIDDLYERYGAEYVDKLAIRRIWDATVQSYVADESIEGKTRVITLALCDAKALILHKLSCKYQNTEVLDSKTFWGVKQWHIKMTIEVLKIGGDCLNCDCTALDKYVDCGNICSDDGTCLISTGTFISASVAKFPCECNQDDCCGSCSGGKPGGSSGVNTKWGMIVGDISNQVDLMNRLNLKADRDTTYTKVEVDDKFIQEIQAGSNVTITGTGTEDDPYIINATGGGGGGGGTWGSITGTLSDQTDLQNALNAKQDNIVETSASDYYRGDKTFQPLNKAAVGLSNVDNTSDAEKPISTATQTALNGKVSAGDFATGLASKENLVVPGTTGDYYRGDKSWQPLNKNAVGLGNVDNTSDAAKPVSTATQTALNGKIGAITGDITTGAVSLGSASSTIANDAVTNSKLSNMAANTIKGNNTGGSADPIDLTVTQTTAMLNSFVGDSGSGGTKGLVPAPASGDAAANKYLKADGTWATVAGGGGGSGTVTNIATGAGLTGGPITTTGTISIDTGGVTNTMLAGSIARSKLVALTASRAMVTDGSGNDSASSVTATELGYLSGVSSSIQSQLTTNAGNISTNTTAIGTKADKNLTITTQTSSYTLVLADAGTYIRMDNASAMNLTIPLNSSVAFPIGTQIIIRNSGAGQVTIVATGGVTINFPDTAKLRKQHSTATLVKIATDTWNLHGDLALS